jgi:hypothetical protein
MLVTALFIGRGIKRPNRMHSTSYAVVSVTFVCLDRSYASEILRNKLQDIFGTMASEEAAAYGLRAQADGSSMVPDIASRCDQMLSL